MRWFIQVPDIHGLSLATQQLKARLGYSKQGGENGSAPGKRLVELWTVQVLCNVLATLSSTCCLF